MTLIIEILSALLFNAGIIYYLYRKDEFQTKKSITIFSIITSIIVSGICVYMWFVLFSNSQIIVYSLMLVIMFGVAYIDYKTKIVDPILLLVILTIGLIFCFLRNDVVFYNPIITAIIFFGIFYLIRKIKKSDMGMGDLKLLSANALIYGFPNIMGVIFYSLIVSLIFGVITIIFKKKNLKYELPFAPFVLIGNVLMIFSMIAMS